jgi:hypothetical protein
MWTLLLFFFLRFFFFLLLILFVCGSNDLFGIRTHAQKFFCGLVGDSAFLVILSEERLTCDELILGEMRHAVSYTRPKSTPLTFQTMYGSAERFTRTSQIKYSQSQRFREGHVISL